MYRKKHDAYPSLKEFAAMVQEQARLKNHPNVLVASQPSNRKPKGREPRPRFLPETDADTNRKVFNTDLNGKNDPKKEPGEEKYCHYYQRKGHLLAECKAFEKQALEVRNECVLRAGLCFRCLLAGHTSSQCNAIVKSVKSGDDRHPTALHKEKPDTTRTEHDEEFNTVCSSVCHKPFRSGVLCSKIGLGDNLCVHRPQKSLRAYTIIDDQSNASMITPNLANRLGAIGPNIKYFLTACSVGREKVWATNFWYGVMLRSLAGKMARLPRFVEGTNIPEDKREIATPEMGRQFSHLKEIADEILPYGPKANVEILIGRDAPELLKIRASRNGPKGAPWAQKLDLGWTISGQVC